MLVEMAIGDAYGAKFEMIMDHQLIERNNDFYYHWKNQEDYQPSLMPAGCYTDDTQMTMAMAEAMLNDEETWSRESIAEWFLEVFHRDKRRGYTTFFLNVLINSEDGRELLARVNGTSTKSGAAMRSAPFGLYQDMGHVINMAMKTAKVTHNSWQGSESAIAVALSSWYMYHNIGPKSDLVSFLNETRFGGKIHAKQNFDVSFSKTTRKFVKGKAVDQVETEDEHVIPWRPELDRPVRAEGWDCMEAALYAIESSDNLADILKMSVSYGGDTDTVACIAMGIASNCQEVDSNLPDQLYESLESGEYGIRYLTFLDKKLMQTYPKMEPEEEKETSVDTEKEEE